MVFLAICFGRSLVFCEIGIVILSLIMIESDDTYQAKKNNFLLWYGMGLNSTNGLKRYQSEKRQQSEDKVMECLFSAREWPTWKYVWKETRIYRNNVKPILENMIREDKAIKLDKVKIDEFCHTKKWDLQRNVIRTIYLPNLKNPLVVSMMKKSFSDLPKTLHEASEINASKSYREHLKIKYGNLPSMIQSFVKDRQDYMANMRRDASKIEEFFYDYPISLALFLLHNA